MSKQVKLTERGWAGHFIGGQHCTFHRNTLLTFGDKQVVVSTVGAYRPHGKVETIGYTRYYETMAFMAHQDGAYIEADVSQEVLLEGDWGINADSVEALPDNADTLADEMHERFVKQVSDKLKKEEL